VLILATLRIIKLAKVATHKLYVFLAIILELAFVTAKKLLICDFIEIGFVDYV
jgi:hypothetical protein